jgi:rhodanese-related sulfurtransferase
MSDIRTLSTSELQKLLDRDDGLHVLNVQTNDFFTGELIPGSRRIPLDIVEHATQGLAKDAAIVTYCAGPECTQSSEAAKRLEALGYTNVRAYIDGLEGWKRAGNELVTPRLLPAA